MIDLLLLLGGITLSVIQSVIFFKILTRLERRVTAVEDFLKETPPSKPVVVNTEDQIATGLMKGMQMLRDDDDRTMKLLELARRMQKQPTIPMTSFDAAQQPFDTGGDLIPANLTKEEQEVLRMYYAKE